MPYSEVKFRMGIVLTAKNLVGDLDTFSMTEAPYTRSEVVRLKNETILLLADSSDSPYMDWLREFRRFEDELYSMTKNEIKETWPDTWEEVIIPFSLGE